MTKRTERTKSIRVSEQLYELAKLAANHHGRSIAEQLEHWAKVALASKGAPSDLELALAWSHELDKMDVATGKRSAESLLFIPRSMARQSKVTFPKKFRKG